MVSIKLLMINYSIIYKIPMLIYYEYDDFYFFNYNLNFKRYINTTQIYYT